MYSKEHVDVGRVRVVDRARGSAWRCPGAGCSGRSAGCSSIWPLLYVRCLMMPIVVDVEVEVLHVVGEAARGVHRLPAAADELLVEDLQVGRVNRVLHGLEPVAVEPGWTTILRSPSRRVPTCRSAGSPAPAAGPRYAQYSPRTSERDTRLLDVLDDGVVALGRRLEDVAAVSKSQPW